MFGAIDEILRYTTLFRTCFFGGRHGGGKTALAVHLASALVAEGHASHITSNIPLNLGVDGVIIDREEVQALEDNVIILDESWLELGKGVDSRRLNSWIAFLRKNNQFVLLPSVMELTSRVSTFAVERRWDLVQIGIPLWIYQWRLETGRYTKRSGESGWFYWVNPTKIFGTYDHGYKPDDKRYYKYAFYNQADEATRQAE